MIAAIFMLYPRAERVLRGDGSAMRAEQFDGAKGETEL
jgi:hypothetical protein